MRAFLAIEIKPYIKENIIETQDIIKESNSSNIKFVEEENIHLTLKFFGEINEETLNEISNIVEGVTAKYDKYNLKIVNVGAFPNIYNPRVIWTGVKDKKVTSQLIEELDAEFSKIGFKKEKNIVPHITIGRVKSIDNKSKLTSTLKELKKRYHGKMEVNSICIKSSKLTPNGPIYNTVKKFNL
jgi:2'-5' RNA ligase